jgi:hypothetical protein
MAFSSAETPRISRDISKDLEKESAQSFPLEIEAENSGRSHESGATGRRVLNLLI